MCWKEGTKRKSDLTEGQAGESGADVVEKRKHREVRMSQMFIHFCDLESQLGHELSGG